MDLRKIVLKPFCGCNANCFACDSRRELYKKIDRSMEMPLDTLISLLDQAKALGITHIAISGGEPLFYRNLFQLISESKKRHFTVALNTNGSLITQDLANKLINSGLDSIFISIDSFKAKDHDFLRRVPIWSKAVKGLDLLINERDNSKLHIKIGIRTILTKYILKQLDQMILFGIDHKVDSHQLSYVEYDKNALLVPSSQDIDYFNKNTKDKIKKIITSLPLSNKNDLLISIDSLFKAHPNRNYSKALYSSKTVALKSCFRPSSFVIILQNGDVAPCNLVEYTHKPLIGNIYKTSLNHIWNNNPILDEFRKKRFDDCKYCPMLIHQKLNYFEGYQS